MSVTKKTKLVNYRTYNLDRSKVIPIDRRSIFGNPFHIGVEHGTREEVVAAYKEWFYICIEIDSDFRKAVQGLKGKTLGCWCTPLPCHGDIIIEYLESLDND